jgi:hypothetical protein
MNYQDIPLADEERRLCLEAFHSSDSVEAIWKAARHYYKMQPRKNTHWVYCNQQDPEREPEMPLDDYEFQFCRHLLKKYKFEDYEDQDPEDGFTYWEIRKGKTWDDIDKAIWGKVQ